VDLTFATVYPRLRMANVKSSAAPESFFASVPEVLTFAKVVAATGCEC
jgi:hypothetical protein